MASLILWRHADAEVESASGRDTDRALTRRGRKDAAKMAKWLAKHLPADAEILSSPARRCLETATALHDISGLEIKVAEYLSLNSSVERIAKEVVAQERGKTIVIVGHQPNLGRLIAKLLGMSDSAVVKKGAVWWMRQRLVGGSVQHYIYTVQLPEY